MFHSLVVGLGNPGREYRDTRHNLGWQVLDALAARERLEWRPAPQFRAEVARWDRPGAPACWLVKPQTFMNASGESVGPLARYHRIPAAQIVAVYRGTPASCHIAPAGSAFSSATGAITTCAAGSYCLGGTLPTQPCHAGTYSALAGATACLTCSAGTYAQAGYTACFAPSDRCTPHMRS
jgi:hypothetical protein